jgi:hypothetical protein
VAVAVVAPVFVAALLNGNDAVGVNKPGIDGSRARPASGSAFGQAARVGSAAHSG